MTCGHKHLTFTATGGVIVANRPCVLYGYLVGLDNTNDATITIYDDESAASGNEVIPTNTYDASLLGVNGATLPGNGVKCNKGLYCHCTLSAGQAEVTVYYS